MSTAPSDRRLQFDSPGPGTWSIDAVHFPRPVTRYWAEFHPEPFKRGFQELTRFYGMPIGNIGWKLMQTLARELRAAEQALAQARRESQQ